MVKKFWIEEHDGADKYFMIYGPIELKIDYDDADHKEQDRLAEKLVRILNNYWTD